jgi:isopentenyl diphosphate isomerase/L-lactate dehydrogenase-like FMN-dependent dehydrogenase
MSHDDELSHQRRQLLQWLAASPLIALPLGQEAFAEDPKELLRNFTKRPDPMIWTPTTPLDLIASPKDAINVFDFEPVAFSRVPPAHFGYMASGIDDEITLRANRTSFLKYQLRPRRLRDVSQIDMSVNLFGTKWKTPIIIAPTGGNKAYDPEGEIAVARAARVGGYLNILSNAGASTIEDVIAARQGEVWFQLYATSSVEVAKKVIRRVEKAGAPVLEITIDRNGGRNQETFFRLKKLDPRNCAGCHVHGIGSAQERPNYDGIDMSAVKSMQSSNMTWDFIKQVRDTTKMKIILKGILTEEDAELCLKYGVDGIHVSNHGGRSEDGGRGSIECLPEVARVARGKVPILFDSGIRRGSDIFKALALGASAVCVGRPYLWGLGAFGQPGVEKVMDILQAELKGVMQQMGASHIRAIESSMVIKES